MMFQFTKPQIKLSKIKCQHKKNSSDFQMHHCILNNLFQNPMNREIENNASMVFHN